jgi:hypothetical protein|nr:MAG TPA: hypothetical protein [Caudoviricetes sp.]
MPIATEALRAFLTQGIKNALDQPIDETSNSDEVKQRFAQNIANAIADGVDAWIKTATVTVQPGIPVSTSGSPTAQTGATTGQGTGTIS